VMLTDKEMVSRTVRTAVRVAQSGRPGPVHLAFPSNIQLEKVEEDILPPAAYRPLDSVSIPEPDTVGSLCGLLYEAENPALLLGYGAARLACDPTLVDFVERLQIPVATSGKAKGIFPEDHPLSLGCLGLRGSKAANTYLREGIDVLLVLGTDLSEMTSHAWDPKLTPSKALIQVDIDPNEIGKNFPVTVGVVADAAATVRALETCLRARPPKPARDFGGFKHSTQYYEEEESYSDAVPMKPQRLMRELRATLPRDTVVFGDMGSTYSWILRYFQSYPEGMNFLPSGLACMGSSVAACIGAKLGKPEAPVVCICGDGDFLMTGMEVLTAVEYRVPVVWIVLKNNRLGLIHDVQALSYQGRYCATMFGDVDFVAIARAFGAGGERVERPDEVGPVVRRALEQDGPVVVEAVIDAHEKFPLTSRATAMKDSVGLPRVIDSLSVESVRALFKMFRDKEK